jgi:hypothetical protein
MRGLLLLTLCLVATVLGNPAARLPTRWTAGRIVTKGPTRSAITKMRDAHSVTSDGWDCGTWVQQVDEKEKEVATTKKKDDNAESQPRNFLQRMAAGPDWTFFLRWLDPTEAALYHSWMLPA